MQHLSKQTLSGNSRYISKAFPKTVFHGQNGQEYSSYPLVTNAFLESPLSFSSTMGSICAKRSTLSWVSVY